MTLTIASFPLPVAWDGRAVKWDRWEAPQPVFICPPPKDERCECGSSAKPYTSRGLRDPDPALTARLDRLPRIGRRTALYWPCYDLHAFRCPDCGDVTVWDMESNTMWTLDEADYGVTGSWAWSGGLLDASLVPTSPDSGSDQ